jgi:hypothetical protein
VSKINVFNSKFLLTKSRKYKLPPLHGLRLNEIRVLNRVGDASR